MPHFYAATCFTSTPPFTSWDAGMVLISESPVHVGDEHWFYYGGFALDHNTKEENIGSIGLLVSQRHRLIGVRPVTETPGFLMTRPVNLPAESRLVVNAIVDGELSVELRTDNNKPIDGFTFADCDAIASSGFDQEVRWDGQAIGKVPVDEVRILFRLTAAQLFTFDLPASEG